MGRLAVRRLNTSSVRARSRPEGAGRQTEDKEISISARAACHCQNRHLPTPPQACRQAAGPAHAPSCLCAVCLASRLRGGLGDRLDWTTSTSISNNHIIAPHHHQRQRQSGVIRGAGCVVVGTHHDDGLRPVSGNGRAWLRPPRPAIHPPAPGAARRARHGLRAVHHGPLAALCGVELTRP